jgi:hypothetical protein
MYFIMPLTIVLMFIILLSLRPWDAAAPDPATEKITFNVFALISVLLLSAGRRSLSAVMDLMSTRENFLAVYPGHEEEYPEFSRQLVLLVNAALCEGVAVMGLAYASLGGSMEKTLAFFTASLAVLMLRRNSIG